MIGETPDISERVRLDRSSLGFGRCEHSSPGTGTACCDRGVSGWWSMTQDKLLRRLIGSLGQGVHFVGFEYVYVSGKEYAVVFKMKHFISQMEVKTRSLCRQC